MGLTRATVKDGILPFTGEMEDTILTATSVRSTFTCAASA